MAPRLPPLPLRLQLFDAAIGVGLGALMLVAGASGVSPAGPSGTFGVGGVALAVAVAAVLSMRHRAPVLVLIATNVITAAWYLGDYPGRLVTVAALIGCYTVAAARGWRWGAVGWAITAATSVFVIHGALNTSGVGDATANALTIEVAAVALGAAVHYHRAFAAGAAERTERVAHARAETERRHAAEQRLQLARELHDVFGHTMATISVQAGVAVHVTERNPGQASRALRTIKTVSDEGLAEVQVLLSLLRTDRTAAGGGLARLDPLLEVTRSTGTTVDLDIDGEPRRLPAAVDLAAFRIVQESLTNARRHAHDAAIRVRVVYHEAMIELLIRNAPASETGASTSTGGHGIDGMRARSLALGGSLDAGPTEDGGFEVRCCLPVPTP